MFGTDRVRAARASTLPNEPLNPSTLELSAGGSRGAGGGRSASSAAVHAQVRRGLLVRADLAPESVLHPDDRHAVAHVVALEVADRGLRDLEGGDLDAGVCVLEVPCAATRSDEEIRAAYSDRAADGVPALRCHVVRRGADIDKGGRREDGMSLSVGIGLVVIDARPRVWADPERVVSAVVVELRLGAEVPGLALVARTAVHRIDRQDEDGG